MSTLVKREGGGWATAAGSGGADLQPEIDELSGKVGDLADLETANKSSLVAAVNEVAQGAGGDAPKIFTYAEVEASGVNITESFFPTIHSRTVVKALKSGNIVTAIVSLTADTAPNVSSTEFVAIDNAAATPLVDNPAIVVYTGYDGGEKRIILMGVTRHAWRNDSVDSENGYFSIAEVGSGQVALPESVQNKFCFSYIAANSDPLS